MPKVFKDPVTIAGIPFNYGPDKNSIDADGVEWYLDGLEGWEDTTAPSIETVQFGYSDGVAMSDRSPLAARYVEVTGVISAPNRLLAQQAFRKLQGAWLPNVYFQALREGPIPETLTMRLAAKLAKVKEVETGFRFATTLIAPWPFKLGTTPRTGTAGVYTGGDYVRIYPRVYPLTYFPSVDDPSTVGTVTRVQLVKSPNSATTPKTQTSYGTGGAGSAATTAGAGESGAYAGVWTWSTAATAGSSAHYFGGTEAADDIPVVAATTVTASVAVKPSIARSLAQGGIGARLDFYTAAGAVVGSAILGTATAFTAGQLQRLGVTATVPATATRARIGANVLNHAGTTNGWTLTVSRPLIEVAGAVGTYFDGTTASPDNGVTQYSWTGTANASTSQAVVLSTSVAPSGPTTVDIVNAGNANAYPVLEVTGPLPANSWYLVNDATGEQQTFQLAIGSGQTLVIDERKQVATLEGSVVDYYIRGDWLYAPPKVTSTFRLVTAENYPAAQVRVTAYDTWM